jgi:mono/diheme cytochrome c family protein
MKQILSFVLCMITAAILFSCHEPAVQTSQAAQPVGKDSLIRRGHYLVSVMGCGDCHTPKKFGPHGPEEDTSRLLSGHPSYVPVAFIDTAVMKDWVLFNFLQTAVAGPWGVSFSANLTSDSTGIGNWTEEQFATALRKGKSKGLINNRDLLPPMPWFNYRNLNDEDFKAIFTYLKSTRPVKNVVPAAIPPTQFNKKTIAAVQSK